VLGTGSSPVQTAVDNHNFPGNGSIVIFLFMAYTVYILQSLINGSYYIGYTQDTGRRFAEHNSGLTRYTAKFRPWQIVYIEHYSSKTEALKREKFLKKQRNKDFYKKLIQGS
jgi:putative endonuclease